MPIANRSRGLKTKHGGNHVDIYTMREGRSGQFTTFDRDSKRKTVLIAPGQKRTLVDADGPGIASRVWFTFPGWFWQHWNTGFPVDPTILRTLILRVFWDNAEYPSIEAPFGDFFGVGHCEYRHYTSRFLGMSSGGFYNYFPMPFNHVRIEVENLHATMDVDVFMNINYQKLERLPEDTGRFHCAFLRGTLAGTDSLPILDANGRGHYVGCCLSIQGEQANYLSFLEAPEYVYVDGERTPSIVGTGLEDYFNGGWYFRNGEFCADLHGVPLKDSLRSMISMYRFHDQDAISFRDGISIRFVNPMQSDRLRPFIYSSTAYWYADRPHPPTTPLPSKRQLVELYRIRDVDHQSIP